jgi:hypothetical protein
LGENLDEDYRMNTPRQIVTAAFDALRANDWKGLASLCDPLSLDAFKIEMLEEFGDRLGEPDSEESASTLEPVELDDEEFIEYMKYLHPDSVMKVEFPKLSTMDDLRRMESVDAFAAWLEGQVTPRKALADVCEEFWQGGSNIGAVAETSRDLIHYPRYTIIGCVFDSMDIAHVVYRPAVSPPERYADVYESWFARWPAEYRDFVAALHHRGIPMLITCRKQTDGSWRIVASRRFMLFGSLSVVQVRRAEGTE